MNADTIRVRVQSIISDDHILEQQFTFLCISYEISRLQCSGASLFLPHPPESSKAKLIIMLGLSYSTCRLLWVQLRSSSVRIISTVHQNLDSFPTSEETTHFGLDQRDRWRPAVGCLRQSADVLECCFTEHLQVKESELFQRNWTHLALNQLMARWCFAAFSV